MRVKTRSGTLFAEWGGTYVPVPAGFDLAETIRICQSDQFKYTDSVGDCPPLDEDPSLSTGSSPISSPISSPLSSPLPSPQLTASPICAARSGAVGEKRKRKTRRSTKSVAPAKSAASDAAPELSAAPDPIQKKSTRRSHVARAAKRSEAHATQSPTAYEPRISSAQTAVSNAEPASSNLESRNMTTATSGYCCNPNRVSEDAALERKKWTLGELCGPGSLGFELVSVKDLQGPIPIIDSSGLVIGVASPPPIKDGKSNWTGVNSDAVSALERERDGPPAKPNKKCKAKGVRKPGLKLSEQHRRGDFGAQATGFSANGGMQYAKRFYHSEKVKRAMDRLLQHPAFVRIAGHGSAIFATWAPKLFQYYSECMDKVLENNPSVYFNFRNSIFAAATFNFGPQTVALEHVDHLNYIYGLCSITALGFYDYTRGGHLILWDLKLVIEFPPGWTILIPSSYLRHGNTDIAPGEKRFSFTQYTSGSLFRYVDSNFKMRTQMTKEEEKQSKITQKERVDDSFVMYSTLQELQEMYCI
ncbi:hypothetical protein VKT23_020431 [Stygiomarasmius scandens]|uniref:Uncharacterized protein n=1 Tax=Marasmiellus scandens TaxID=2682957 RepID=A0ABR1IJ39_9AGAR